MEGWEACNDDARPDGGIDGETDEDCTLCESVRTERGPRQRVVATLGKLDDSDLRAGYDPIEALRDGRQPWPRRQELPSGTLERSETGCGRGRAALKRPGGCV